MRKMILAVLLATGVALPAMAQDINTPGNGDQGNDGFGARKHDRSAQDTSGEQRSEAREARRAERAERTERERPQVADRADWSVRGEARQRAVEQQAAQSPVVEQPQGGERQGWSQRRGDTNRGDGQRRWNGGEGARDQAIQQPRDGRRDRWRGPAVEQANTPTAPVVIQHRDGRRDGDHRWDGRRWDGRRDETQSRYAGTNRQWSNQWRQDRNYDWRNHRDRHRSVFRLGNYYDPYGSRYRRFSIGFSLFPSYYQSNFWLDDPWMYRLPPAYGPYRWVRYYDDALLVNIYTGQVADVIYSFFW